MMGIFPHEPIYTFTDREGRVEEVPMKTVIDIAPHQPSLDRAEFTYSALYTLLYTLEWMLLAVAFPTLFWVVAVVLLGKVLDIPMTAETLMYCALAVSGWSFMGASLVMRAAPDEEQISELRGMP
jgi:hypothetical protein